MVRCGALIPEVAYNTLPPMGHSDLSVTTQIRTEIKTCSPVQTYLTESAFPKKATELASQLEEWKRLHARAYPVRGKISEEDLRRLKSLGYIE